ncbi:fatty acid--CoA ligase [Falsibacillus pallidus]|uniref:Fatty-acyl-CoA synthase n=1 Tax=Falsibacillus pallidus TaxID=493781 RepID=A0A370GMW0_9BACI|nr:fatty acid--CoA ligase [Falsibacillus pallidus]RDI43233.1 fatty-acyl-CoA synthase [Falsibacillus pallidus]
MYVTIGNVFEQSVNRYPHKEALVDLTLNKRWTFQQWNEDVNRTANALMDNGVRKGDRVSTFLCNGSELAILYFACAKIGAIVNPINFRLKTEEVAFILNDAKPKILLFEKSLSQQVHGLHEQFPETLFWSIHEETLPYARCFWDCISDKPTVLAPQEVAENDIYAIMYTSGTTGRPKGVLHRHRDMIEQSLTCIAVKQIRPKDIGLVAAPMFHCAELHCCFLPRVHVGAKNVIIHHFEPKEVLKTISDEKISTFFGAPTMWNMLLQEDLSETELSSLRIGLYGAAPMAPVLVTAVREKLGINLIQAYGQTEMGPAVSFLLEDEQIHKAGSAGKACYNHEIRIVKPNEDGPSEPEDILPAGAVGEIIVRGPSMMAGYFNREEASEKALFKGWYHTGDLGYMDTDGYLFIADRVDDMVISGGENIYPREVEDFLFEHEGVLDAAVLGAPHEKWGEEVVAFIVKKEPSLTAEILDAFCKGSAKLADYKRPRKYYFVDQLPRNASGKIQKFLLKSSLKEIDTPVN